MENLPSRRGKFVTESTKTRGKMSGRSAFRPATIERLDSAITLTAYVMQRHSLPQLLPTLKRLQAARDDLLVNGDALEYAARVLARCALDITPSLRIASTSDQPPPDELKRAA